MSGTDDADNADNAGGMRDAGGSGTSREKEGRTTRRRRADLLLTDQGGAESRSRAQALIMAGRVHCGPRRIDKPGMLLPADAVLTVRRRDHPWVGRGGLKLAHGLDHFRIDPAGMMTLDLGASTGGFTDVLLSRGAAQVTAVDVGRGQLHWRLRSDARVRLLEGVNARYLDRRQVPDAIDLVVCDASFIGLEKILPAALELTADGARLLALIKPQFQVARHEVGKGGLVRDATLQQRVCGEVANWLAARPGWRVLGLTESPIEGARGNREFLIAGERRGA